MDFEDWEYLPDAATCHLLRDDDGGGIAAGRVRSSPGFTAKSVFNMDYFSSTDSFNPPAKLLIPSPQFVPLQFRSPTLQAQDVVQRLLHDTASPQQRQDTTPDSAAAASQVFFKNSFSKEANEFVDMRVLDSSPRSKPSPKGSALIGDLRFDEKTDDLIITSPRKKNMFDLFNEGEIARNLTFIESENPHQLSKNDVNWIGEGIIGDDDCAIDDDGIIGGLNFWKLGFAGIGAIGVAAVFLLIFGHNHKAKKNHKLRFQINDDQRMKEGVQQATKLDEAMSAAAARGVPLNRAHVTYGGFYDNAL